MEHDSRVLFEASRRDTRDIPRESASARSSEPWVSVQLMEERRNVVALSSSFERASVAISLLSLISMRSSLQPDGPRSHLAVPVVQLYKRYLEQGFIGPKSSACKRL